MTIFIRGTRARLGVYPTRNFIKQALRHRVNLPHIFKTDREENALKIVKGLKRMKRDFLKELGLTDEQMDKVMAANGEDINREKAKFADYDDIKKQRDDAEAKIASFGDVEAIKAEVEKYKTEAETAKAESAAKIKKLELQQQVKEFTATKKFVNERTRKSINQQLEDELNKEEAKGKSMAEIFEALTKDESDLFVEEKTTAQPPVVPNMTDDGKDDQDDAKIRAIMGLGAKKE